jgi:hypothetical protein
MQNLILRAAVELEAALDVEIAAYQRPADLCSHELPMHAAEALLHEARFQSGALTDQLERLHAEKQQSRAL